MYKLSNLAAEDFAAIYEYTLLNFGALQADLETVVASGLVADPFASSHQYAVVG